MSRGRIDVPLVSAVDAHQRDVSIAAMPDVGDGHRAILLSTMPVPRPADWREWRDHATFLAPLDARRLAEALVRAADELEQIEPEGPSR